MLNVINKYKQNILYMITFRIYHLNMYKSFYTNVKVALLLIAFLSLINTYRTFVEK